MKRNTLVGIALTIAAIIATAVTFAARGLRETKPASATAVAAPAVAAPAEKPAPAEDPAGKFTTGAPVTRYAATTPDYIEKVFAASKRSLDELECFRTGETPRKDGVTIYARARGDITIAIDLDKKVEPSKDGATQEWVYVSIRYGSQGNAAKSAEIVSTISRHLGNPR